MKEPELESTEKIKEYYENVYYSNAKPSDTVSSHHRGLADRIGIASGQHVLDVACGTGEWLFCCSQLGALPSGIDLSEKATAICQQVMPDGVFHSGEAETLPFESNQFEVITCLGSLEHFVEPEKALREMMRVAKDDAQFVILVPNSGFLTRRIGLFSGTWQTDAKEHVRSLDEWDALFRAAGLRVEERWRDLHVLSWSWIKLAKWYMAPFRLLQALALTVWPIDWQYQVFHLCRKA